MKRSIDSPNVPCSDEQIAAPHEFKSAIFDFLCRNTKFLQPSHELEMTLDIMLEILELLKTIPQEKSNVAPTGNSDHPYYKTSGWNDVWKYMFLVDHDFSPISGHFNSILLEPIDVADRANAAGDMLPDNHVQLEGDYFSMNKVDASWEVGHVGVSDLRHQYWPLTYQIAKGKQRMKFVRKCAIAQ